MNVYVLPTLAVTFGSPRDIPKISRLKKNLDNIILMTIKFHPNKNQGSSAGITLNK